MALTPSWPGPTGIASTTDGRKALAGLIVKNTAGVARAGVFPAHENALVAASSDMNVDIAAFQAAAVQFGGPVLLTNDGTAQLPSLLVSPASGTNYYVVYAKQNESTSPGTDASNTTVFGATVSTASFASARSLLPTGAVELSTVQMPTGKTATNQTGVVITASHQFTAAAGAAVLLRNQTEQDAWTPYDGSLAYRLDLDQFIERVNGAWVWEETGTFSYGALYQNHASYDSVKLTRAGKRCRLRGTATINQAVSFVGGTNYVLGTVPTGWRPAAGAFRPAAISPINAAWLVMLSNGNLEFALLNSTSQPANGWLIGFDIEWDIP